MTLGAIAKYWNRFWFEPQSAASICVFRILFGLFNCLNAILLFPDASEFFGPNAVISSITIQSHWGPRFGILTSPQNDAAVYSVLIILLLASVFLTLGLLTRISAAIAFVCLVSLAHRNGYVLNSGDTLLRFGCLFLAFSPAGYMYSLDRRLGHHIAKALNMPWLIKDSVCEPWVQRLIQLQICTLYFFSFWYKTAGDTWLDGTAVYYATRLVDFARFPIPFVLDNAICIHLLTWGALAIECMMWTLVWVREARYKVLLLALMLHLGIEWTMNIPVFEWVMITCLLLFCYPMDVERCVDWLEAKLRSVARSQQKLETAALQTGTVSAQ